MSSAANSAADSSDRTLIYLLRHDLRLADNPIFHALDTSPASSSPRYTHLLPVYVFAAQQIEVSGFLARAGPDTPHVPKSPYPEARSQVGHFWRCGPHRARFLAESVTALRAELEAVPAGSTDTKSGLVVRVGLLRDVVKALGEGLRKQQQRVDVWMTAEEGTEEKAEEREVRRVVEGWGGEFKLWRDEKYFVDDRDLPYSSPKDLDDIFTSFRKRIEPLREAPRPVLPAPSRLPPLPATIPPQAAPFAIPDTHEGIVAALLAPLKPDPVLAGAVTFPPGGAESAHPFVGGAAAAQQRVKHLLASGAMTAYKDTRNQMLGRDGSTKLSAWLALGCLTARQVHAALVRFEDGVAGDGVEAGAGFGKGENKGTGWVRFELLWRDYFRLCTRKFGSRLFHVGGFRDVTWQEGGWKADEGVSGDVMRRWMQGRTGMGMVDASQRELVLTGYTSNRARQNVASFLAKHLKLDWRLGAEWYECWLVDYDVGSNWGNWQYTAGVGNDPREGGLGRKFNPVKQTGDYDREGKYIKAWCPELRLVPDVDAVAQCWKVPEEKRKALGLEDQEGCDRPLVRIEYQINRGRGGGYSGQGRGDGGRGNGRGRGRGRGRGSGRDGFSKRD